MNLQEKLWNRFFEKVDVKDREGCWEWKGALSSKKYGQFVFEKRAHRSHRWIASRLWPKEVTSWMQVCHHCDNPRCVNPMHLFIGTRSENAIDMVNKGRNRFPDHRGERNPGHKLTKEEIHDIREMYASGMIQKEIAKKFNVCRPTISLIVNHKTWKEQHERSC